MATVCHPGTGQVTASFAAVAKHYGVSVACGCQQRCHLIQYANEHQIDESEAQFGDHAGLRRDGDGEVGLSQKRAVGVGVGDGVVDEHSDHLQRRALVVSVLRLGRLIHKQRKRIVR